MFWIILGIFVVAAIVGTTSSRSQTFKVGDSKTTVTSYSNDEANHPVSNFIGLVGITIIFPPLGIYLVIKNLVDASKRGHSKVEHTRRVKS